MVVISKGIAGFLAGFSVGIYCLSLCLPVFLPILLSQKRTVKASLLILLEFSTGRLAGYLFFGLIIGWIGQIISNSIIHNLAGLANIWIGTLMIFYSLGNIDKKLCPRHLLSKVKWPFLLGFLTGVNVCPPFLGSLVYVFNLKDILLSLYYFFMFFLGTSTYIVPLVFFGFFTKFKIIPKLARVSGVIAGLYFVFQSLIRAW